MSYISASQILCINSNNRDSGSSSNFTASFDIRGDYDYCVCKSASIPKTYYLVQNTYNTFQLSEDGIVVTITIPMGNYTKTDFSEAVKLALNTASPHGYIYSLVYEQLTGKFKYSVSGNALIQPIFIIQENLYDQLGFNYNTSNQFVANKITSTNVIVMQLEQTIQIRTNMVGNSLGENIIQTIYSSGQDYTNLNYQVNDIQANSRKFIGSSNNKFTFYLTNENGEEIDLQGVNFYFEILLWKKENVNDVIKRFLTLMVAQSNLKV